MRKLTFTLSILAVLCLYTSAFAQTIRRCNNNAGVTGLNVYTTIQDAHDAAVDGDVIYVEPSASSYGILDCTKRLTIIGNGFFLSNNTDVAYDVRQSILFRINFYTGSEYTVVRGITIGNFGQGFPGINFNLFNQIGQTNSVSHITLNRCKIEGDFGFNTQQVSNITVSQCFITGNVHGYINFAHPNCVFTNNFIGGGLGNFSNSIVSNNVFYTGPGQYTTFLNSIITNNIWRSNACDGCTQTPIFNATSSGNTISNNIVAASGGSCISSLPNNSGNVNNADYSTIFLTAEPMLIDNNFQLAPTSPAKGIGTGGTDAGAFGGANPYVLSGLPPVPITTNFNATGAGNTNVPIQVSVTVRSNN